MKKILVSAIGAMALAARKTLADKEHFLEFDVDVERRAATICIDAALYGPPLYTTFSTRLSPQYLATLPERAKAVGDY
ncbi:hypothetical protein ABID65_008161 [Bradyrhizobium sp. S3.9.2]|uniref:hypothetical protein n=1 Tax=Bradyrhizobium sp. S3.9.2 TaxID=3156432 RepID=UPI003395742F